MENRKISISQIQFVAEHYPRSETDNDVINQYRLNLGGLPPITVNRDYILVDGYHRLLAHKIEGKTEISCEVLDVPGNQVLKEAIRRNASHGWQLRPAEKKSLALRVYQNESSEEEIAELLAVSVGHVQNWLVDIKTKERHQRNQEIMKLYLQCWTQEEIAEKFHIDQSNVAKIIENMKNSENVKNSYNPPEPLQIYNIWKIPRLSDAQLRFPGQQAESLYENLLWYFTKPFDVVYEPTAGSGILGWVAERMYRRYQLSDINPLRAPIKKHDITAGYPDWLVRPDLIFLDPPYWQQKKDSYIKHENNLASLELDDFHNILADIILSARKVLRPGGYVALIIGPTQQKGTIYDHAFEIYKKIDSKKFNFAQRIIIPYSTEQAQAFHVSDAKEKKYLLKLYRDLLVWERR